MRQPRFGIRARTTLTAAAIVGIALAVGSAAFVFLVTHALRSSMQSAAATRASDVALLAQSGSLPTSLPGRGDALLVQVVSNGKVISSSRDLTGRRPLVSVSIAPGQTTSREIPSIPDLQDSGDGVIDVDPTTSFLVTARGVQTKGGPATVLVASSLSPLEDAVGILVPLLLALSPAALALVVIATWVLTGLALRPVGAMREHAERISSSVSGERLPVPLAHDEIHDLAETMNRMLQRIEASGIAQRQFISDASHELKSPVAAIRMMVEVAMHDPAHVDLTALLTDIAAEDQRLELLVADLLLLATADEGRLRVDLRDTDLGRVVDEEISSVTHRGGLELIHDSAQAVRLCADESRLRQLLRNLLDNATRYAARRVMVTTHIQGDTACIEVSDDGPGVPPEAHSRVFDRFVRIDEGRGRPDGGTGLGLPVCRAIVQAHGGTIEIAEPALGGTTVRVCLPLSL